jgi:hypothetical protein
MSAAATGAAGSRRAARVLLVAGAFALAPVLLAGPAYAETSTPTPIASEPPGGATCLPGTSATCGQDTGTSASPSASATPTAAATATPTPAPAVTTLPNTGSKPASTLAHTGSGTADGWGYAGTALLVGGSALVLATRRPRRTSR